jgi:hypothetical protein
MPSIAVDVRKGVDETEANGRPIYFLHRLLGATAIVSDTRMVDDQKGDSDFKCQVK